MVENISSRHSGSDEEEALQIEILEALQNIILPKINLLKMARIQKVSANIEFLEQLKMVISRASDESEVAQIIIANK